MRRSHFVTGAGALGGALAVRGRAVAEPAPVSIGAVLAVSDAPLLVAQELNYFRDAGITATFQNFASGATLISSLASGQLDVGGGSASAGLFNAVGRGGDLKLVADRGINKPGYGYVSIVVRTDLITSGKVRSLADLRGLRVAESAKGSANVCQVIKALGSVNLSYDDVQHVFLGFPDQLLAFQSGAIDAATMPEPYVTIAKRNGVAVTLISTDVFYPNQETSMMLYSGAFINQRAAVANAFMVAYLRGQRFVLDALRGAHFRGPNADVVVGILNRKLNIEPAILREMTVGYMDPNGRLNLGSIAEDLAIYRAQHLIEGNATVASVVDMRFADAAAKRLGRYRARA